MNTLPISSMNATPITRDPPSRSPPPTPPEALLRPHEPTVRPPPVALPEHDPLLPMVKQLALLACCCRRCCSPSSYSGANEDTSRHRQRGTPNFVPPTSQSSHVTSIKETNDWIMGGWNKMPSAP